jgi:hypothetical protein
LRPMPLGATLTRLRLTAISSFSSYAACCELIYHERSGAGSGTQMNIAHNRPAHWLAQMNPIIRSNFRELQNNSLLKKPYDGTP